ncbi:MAG: hypothetical protein QNJ22_13705 [Desulfosarcinaceae bacterium]|nr:hypothetical protein [Desulfosarcinaceae bacterium]
MPSSTSSSETAAAVPVRPPADLWRRIWSLALLVALLLLGVWELGWRLYGFVPSVEDDWGIWASRRRLLIEAPEKVALVGASRIQLGVDPERFQRESGRAAVMLAIDGNAPLAVLSDLAEDPRFNGSVLLSYVPMFFGETAVSDRRARKWLRRYRQQTRSSRLETTLRIAVQERFVFRYPGLAPARIWEHLTAGTRPRLIYAPMRTDRYRAADYDLIDIDQLREARARRERRRQQEAQPLTAAAFEERIKNLSLLVRQIQRKGGRVAVVRMPSQDAVRSVEAATWPRRRFWDRLANRLSIPFIHFEDHAELAAFDCPDGSHLGAEDAQLYTAALVKILKRNGFFD